MSVLIPIVEASLTGTSSGVFTNVFDKTVLQYAIDSARGRRVLVITDVDLAAFDSLQGNYFVVYVNKPTRGAIEALARGLEKVPAVGKCFVMPGDTYFSDDVVGAMDKEDKNVVAVLDGAIASPKSASALCDGDAIVSMCDHEKAGYRTCAGAYAFLDAQVLRHYCKKYLANHIIRGENSIHAVVSLMIADEVCFAKLSVAPCRYFPMSTADQIKRYVDRCFGFLFDLDGTLVVSDALYLEIWRRLMKPFGIELSSDMFKECVHSRSDADVLSRLLAGFKYDVGSIAAQKDALFCECISRLEVVPGSVEFVKTQKRNGHKTAIVTNCNRLVAERTVEYLGLTDFIDLIVIGSECPRAKPHSDPYERVVQHFSIASSRCLVFEDSVNGILSGNGISPWKNVGIATECPASVLLSHGADVVFKDFTEIDVEELLNVPVTRDHDLHVLLQRKFLNEHVQIEVGKLKGGFIADVISAKVGSKALVLKVVSVHANPLRDMATALDLYETEYYFYDRFSTLVPVKLPEYYGRLYNNQYECIGIVLEDLRRPSFVLNIDLNTDPIDTSLAIVDAIAKMHAQFWRKDLVSKFSELKRNNTRAFNWATFVEQKFEAFFDKWSHVLTAVDREYVTKIARDFGDTQEYLSTEPLTLCHGDVKAPNIFFERRDHGPTVPYFLDWQYVVEGKGVQDLVFFMIESFSTTRIVSYFSLLKMYYYVKLMEYGVRGYSLEEFNMDFRRAAHYFPLFVAVWFGTVPEDELIDRNFPALFLQRLISFYRLMNTPS